MRYVLFVPSVVVKWPAFEKACTEIVQNELQSKYVDVAAVI